MAKVQKLKKEEDKVSLKEFLLILLMVVKLFWSITPFYLVINIVTNIVSKLYVLVNALVLGFIIDEVIKLAQENIDYTRIVSILAIVLLIRAIEEFINILFGFSRRVIRIKSGNLIRRKFYLKVNTLGVQTLEDPDFTNILSRARENLESAHEILQSAILLASLLVLTVSSAFAVINFLPQIVVLLIVITIPNIIFETHFIKKEWALYKENTEKFRYNNSNASALSNKNQLPEILINSGEKFMDSKVLDFHNWFVKLNMKIAKPWYFLGFIFDLTKNIVIIFFGYFNIISSYVNGVISLGDLTFQFRTLDILQSNLNQFLSGLSTIRQSAIRLKEVKQVFNMQPQFQDGEKMFPKLQTPPSIRFENIEFAYPNSETKVIKNLNLEIKSGEKVAIVGKNGAGKTTLVKLISKFYQPTSGNILINEVENLQDYNSESWHANIGVLMQDYNKYEHMTVKENVIMGDPNKPANDDEIKKAIEFADAKDFVEAYTNQYDQILSENFKGGTRPSGGQWQKIALARFFYRNAPLLIFDEPTSAIDAESEFKIFNKIYEFFENKTVIIISHRFSTVRNADRIIVLDDGSVLENGSHDELMKLGGKYAEMFRLQAVGYGEK